MVTPMVLGSEVGGRADDGSGPNIDVSWLDDAAEEEQAGENERQALCLLTLQEKREELRREQEVLRELRHVLAEQRERNRTELIVLRRLSQARQAALTTPL
jgi:hypothetical protein